MYARPTLFHNFRASKSVDRALKLSIDGFWSLKLWKGRSGRKWDCTRACLSVCLSVRAPPARDVFFVSIGSVEFVRCCRTNWRSGFEEEEERERKRRRIRIKCKEARIIYLASEARTMISFSLGEELLVPTLPLSMYSISWRDNVSHWTRLTLCLCAWNYGQQVLQCESMLKSRFREFICDELLSMKFCCAINANLLPLVWWCC